MSLQEPVTGIANHADKLTFDSKYIQIGRHRHLIAEFVSGCLKAIGAGYS